MKGGTWRSTRLFQSEKGNNKQAAKLLEFLLRGGVDVVDKLVYSLRSAGQSELAKTCLRDPQKADEWGSDEDKETEKENQRIRRLVPVQYNH